METFSNSQLSDLFPGAVFTRVQESKYREAQDYLDGLTKPKGSLGKLENIAARLYAIQNGGTPLVVDPSIMFTAAGDHGVACKKVSPFPQSVTRQMVLNFLRSGAAINALCKASGMDLKIVDAGCAGGPFSAHPLLLEKRLGDGTQDISEGPAMELSQCQLALAMGLELACQAADHGYKSVGCGEMGIANSTSASALYCALLGLSPESVVGPGAGADSAMLKHKIRIVSQSLKVNARFVDSGQPVAILAALGGFETALLAGIMLGCASRRIPVLVDGFICTSAYAAALAIWPGVADYAFISHTSAEPAYGAILQKLPDDPYPLLHMDMRLGEGTGCALALPILRGAAAIFNEMATFVSACVTATEADRITI